MLATKRLWGQAILIALLLLTLSGTTLAKFEWSVKPVTAFTVPASNLIEGGDMSGGIPGRFQFGYEWVANHEFDTKTFLIGSGSVAVSQKEGTRGRVYIDTPVDSTKKYKFGFVVRTENLKPGPLGQSLRWGVYLKDGLGAWINTTEPLKSLSPDYLHGLVGNSIVTRTPDAIDLGDGFKPLSGSSGWLHMEMMLDLPALANDLQAGLGVITTVRIDQTLYDAAGKVWINCVYLVPVD